MPSYSSRIFWLCLGVGLAAPAILAAGRAPGQAQPATPAVPARPAQATARQAPAEVAGDAPTPARDRKGTTPPEYRRPNRWGLTAGGSQRHDWLTGRNRFELHEHLNARKILGMPDWLDGMLEFRSRYETFDTPWQRGQAGSQHQAPL